MGLAPPPGTRPIDLSLHRLCFTTSQPVSTRAQYSATSGTALPYLASSTGHPGIHGYVRKDLSGSSLQPCGRTYSKNPPPPILSTFLYPVLGSPGGALWRVRQDWTKLSRAPSPCPPPAEVLVLYGYRAQKEDELSLVPGDVVRQVRQGPVRGWLRGELGGRCGLFPERRVQEIPENLRGTAEGQRPRCARRRGHAAKFPGPQRWWCKVNFSYSPEQADELKLEAGEMVEVLKEIEDGWWLGQKNGQLGAFPSNFVELLDSGPPSVDIPDMPSVSSCPQRPPKLSCLTYDSPPDYLRTVSHPETYRVLFDYQPEAPDELELRRGDVVKVLRKTTEDKGWWEGESQGRRGVFPDNFVLPPPPIKKLVPRKVVSRESAPVKEPKKMMPKTALPAVKKLVTVPTGPSKAKPSWTSSRENQKRPSRDSGSSSRVLDGVPGHPGKKQSRSKTQVPQQRSAPSQEEEQSSRAKAPSMNKSPALDQIPKPEKTLPDKAATPKKTPTLNKGPTPEKTLTPNKAPPPEKTPTLSKASTPEKSLTLDRVPSLEKAPTLDKTPTPENTPTLDKTPTAEKTPTPDRVSTPEMVFFMDKDGAPEVPAEDEAPDPKTAPSGDEAPIPDKILTQGQVFSEAAPCTRPNTEFHPLSLEEGLQKAVKEARSQEEGPVPLEPLPQPSCPGPVKARLCEKDGTPPRPGLELGSKPTPDKAHPPKEATVLLQETLGEDEATRKETVPKEEVPYKELTPPKKEASPQEEVPPKVASAREKPHPTTPGPQETHSLHSLVQQNPTQSQDDRVDLVKLKEEVESLRRSLELMGVQLERKLTGIWEELKKEKEQRQLLEVQMIQRTQESPTRESVHSQTQTY
ncbi:SH3 domain-containing protein 21 [Orycteropus afer afer]|uniref:SH3 domain-containing protein 21 n=1 Tax=Orycteropus afer afer TaxID=1230840 RepID=A0A8B7AEG6_ORYAF|nr:SH3 domain-containing protein 21 [Orycteropus afer afer]